MIFGADEGDMIVNKTTGTRTPIVDTGKEFVLDIYVPGGRIEKPVKQDVNGFNESGKVESDKAKSSGEKVIFGCKAVEGGFWNSLIQEDDSPESQVCCRATFRRHP